MKISIYVNHTQKILIDAEEGKTVFVSFAIVSIAIFTGLGLYLSSSASKSIKEKCDCPMVAKGSEILILLLSAALLGLSRTKELSKAVKNTSLGLFDAIKESIAYGMPLGVFVLACNALADCFTLAGLCIVGTQKKSI